MVVRKEGIDAPSVAVKSGWGWPGSEPHAVKGHNHSRRQLRLSDLSVMTVVATHTGIASAPAMNGSMIFFMG